VSHPRLVLASSSPRRAELMSAAGFELEVLAPGVDEATLHADVASPSRRATLLALAKARAVAPQRPNSLILGADTMVVLGASVLGKPRDATEALAMLSRLSGTSHEVVTGLALLAPGGIERTGFAATQVTFARWPQAELVAYARSGKPLDKAGGYGIQEEAGVHIERVSGCYFNVVGLPLTLLSRLLAGLSALQPHPEG
jgi:septum formation protein